MTTVFLLQNQRKELLNRQGEWVDGREASTLFRTVHRDEALNQLIETNTRDYTLRMKILECPLNDRGQPLIADEDLPPLQMAGDAAVAPVAVASESDESDVAEEDALAAIAAAE